MSTLWTEILHFIQKDTVSVLVGGLGVIAGAYGMRVTYKEYKRIASTYIEIKEISIDLQKPEKKIYELRREAGG